MGFWGLNILKHKQNDEQFLPFFHLASENVKQVQQKMMKHWGLEFAITRMRGQQ
jgi:peroxiredoxin family protein